MSEKLRHRRIAAARRRASAADAPEVPAVDRLERVRTLTQTARATWFGFLGAAAFATVTLSSVRDIDFFSAASTTQLPIINIAVPVTGFFLGGAVLMTLAYAYLHVFLEKLWRALGRLPARQGDEPIAHAIHPWIVADFALAARRLIRAGERRDTAAGARVPISLSPLGIAGALASFLLCWAAGPLLLAWFWLRSMPAHIAPMTVTLGILVAVTLSVMLASLSTLTHHMRAEPERKPTRSLIRPFLTFLILAALTVPVSFLRTTHDFLAFRGGANRVFASFHGDETAAAWSARQDNWQKRQERRDPAAVFLEWFRPVPANLENASITALPVDWVRRDVARRDGFSHWCDRPDTPDCRTLDPDQRTRLMLEGDDPRFQEPFGEEFVRRRASYLRALDKPLLGGADLARASMVNAHLVGLDLRASNLEGATLRFAELEGAFMDRARLSGANLASARLPGASLVAARLERAAFISADLREAELRGARMEAANLSNADLSYASLSAIRMTEGSLRSADLWHANLRAARIFDSDVGRARFAGAWLDLSLIAGLADNPLKFFEADFTGTASHGGAFRHADFTSAEIDLTADLRWSFGDGSVRLSPGTARPCQWLVGPAEDDAEFYARWRGWLKRGREGAVWRLIAPAGFEDIEPIEPADPDCQWQTDPLPTGP